MAEEEPISGADALLETLLASGIDTCFANPGTSEIHFVAALERSKAMRSVLCLFEGVVTGAADGYGRMTGKPAVTLLHLGPGFANGWANLHNARKARTSVVNVVGDHATWHLEHNAPLTSDLAGVAGSVSHWVHSSKSPEAVGRDAAEAVRQARSNGGQIATLILPGDASWDMGGITALPHMPPRLPQVPDDKIAEAVEILRSDAHVAILATSPALEGAALATLARIAKSSGATVFCDYFNTRLERGAGRFAPKRLMGYGPQVTQMLEPFDYLITVGTVPPIRFFGHPSEPSVLTPESTTSFVLGEAHEDVVAALSAVAEGLGVPSESAVGGALQALERPEPGEGPLTPQTIALAVGRFLPEGAIVSDEGATSGPPSYAASAGAPPHDWLSLMGGSIGQGPPVATGAAVACPDRKVLSLQADGSAMYTLQALWTQAREKLDITTVLFSNRRYAILERSLGEYGIQTGSNQVPPLFDLSNPDIDWRRLAEGMGVEGFRCETTEDFNKVFEDCMKRKGPHLIEAVI